MLGEQRGQLGDARVELVHVGVQLDAVAGGEQRGLGGRFGGDRVLQQLDLGVRVQRGPLQDADRGAAVAQPDDEETHAGITAGTSPSGPLPLSS